MAVALERRRSGWRVVEAGPAGAFDPSWWARVEAGPAQAVVAGERGGEATAGAEGASEAFALAEAAARRRLAAVTAGWARELTARRAREEGRLLDYYRRRLAEELRGLKRAVHQVAVLQVRVVLAQRAETLKQFQQELAGWEKELAGTLAEKRGVAGALARELGRRYRELERRYQGEARVTLLAVARLPGR